MTEQKTGIKKYRPIALDIEKEIWQKFRALTPRTLTLNNAVVELIKKDIEKKEKR